MSEPVDPFAYDRLCDRRRDFVDAYLGASQGNAAKAARIAGYSKETAKQEGYRLKRDPLVLDAIKERTEALAMSAEEVLGHLAAIARGSLDDIMDFDRRSGGAKKLNLIRAQAEGNLGLVQELSFNKFGPKVKLYSRVDALQLLGKHHGLFVDRMDVDFTEKDPLPKVDDAELMEELRRRFAARKLADAGRS